MFTLACEQVLHFLGKKISANQKRSYDVFHMWKNIVQPIKTLIRQISRVKNIVCSELRILFQPNTTRKSLYSYNKKCYEMNRYNFIRTTVLDVRIEEDVDRLVQEIFYTGLKMTYLMTKRRLKRRSNVIILELILYNERTPLWT